jgi:arginase
VNRHYAIIEAPSVLGLRPTGVETLPDALLRAGLATRLRARRAGRVEPPPYDDRRDPETLMLNPNGIAEYTSKLADAIGKVLDTGDFPVVLGGDCSIVLGGADEVYSNSCRSGRPAPNRPFRARSVHPG